MSRTGLCHRLGFVFAMCSALPAHAYRNPERFAAPVDVGGGGGKYFTLSRAEGYGCAVCHSASTPVPVALYNLPTADHLPGQVYRITIDWPDDMPSVALNVEVTDARGASYGLLSAADPATLSAADLCASSDVSEPGSAGQTVQLDANGRRVLLIAECGQAQASFDWIAPAVRGDAYFSTSILFSNRDGKLAGDRVVDIVEPLSRQPTNRYAGSCAAARRPATSRGLAVGVYLFAVLLYLRARRRPHIRTAEQKR